MRWSIESKITAGFAGALLLILIIGLIARQNAVQFLNTNQQVTRTFQVLNEIEGVLLSITTAESEARAYFVSEDEYFIDTSQNAQVEASQGIQNLRTLTLDNPDQQALLDELEASTNERLTLLNTAIEAQQRGGAEERNQVTVPGRGRELMNAVRATAFAMIDTENTLLANRTQTVQSSGQMTLLAFAVLTLIIAAMLIVMFAFIRRDITGRRRVEAVLASERNLLQTLMDNLPDSVYIKDTNSRFITNNKTHRQIMGAPNLEKMIGTTDFDWFPKDLATLYFEGEQEMFRNNIESITREDPVIDAAQNHLWYLSTKVLLRDQNKRITGLVGISRNITEHKRREDEIHRLNHELEVGVRDLIALNQELEAFSYSVSHDLRAPLRAMSGFSRIVAEEYAATLPPEAIRYLSIIRSNAEQMGQLIDGLLTFSRLSRQALSKQTVKPAELAQQVIDELHEEQSGRQVEITIADDMPAFQADPILLRQVYANLIGNAFKFTKNCETARIEIGWQQGENGLKEYFVKDNGAGFDIQYANKLFGVFQRLHRVDEYEGTGVGLAIVQRILHRHGGSIRAEAEVNKGATFYFTVEGKSA
jgi:PAS domain S-box-containing protein